MASGLDQNINIYVYQINKYIAAMPRESKESRFVRRILKVPKEMEEPGREIRSHSLLLISILGNRKERG